MTRVKPSGHAMLVGHYSADDITAGVLDGANGFIFVARNTPLVDYKQTNMMAMSRDLKRSNNFSIDAIMSSGCSTTSSSSSPADRVPSSKDLRCPVEAPRAPPIEPGSSLLAVLPGYDANRIAAVAAAAARTNPAWGIPGVGSPLYGNIPSPLLASAQVAAFPDSIQAIHQAQMFSQHHKQSVPFYNWFLTRQGDYFGRVLQESDESYLFGFRKPKRIRTAFSPDQLIHLEHAFELNHYVVGQERKDLAAELGLSETQVKVWFQNRRTKFKRVQTDEDDDSPMTSASGDAAHAPMGHPHHSTTTTTASNRSSADKGAVSADEEEEFVDVESPPQTPAPSGDHRVNCSR